MKFGISTASLFPKYFTEDAIALLNKNNVDTAEVFLESFCEYNKNFGNLLNGKKGNMDVHSVHTLTSQFEPQLYSINVRAQKDSFDLLEDAMSAGEAIGAKYYTFHGVARIRKAPMVLNFERIGEVTNRICEVCASHGITLAYENVHWAYYNYIGFFTELKKRVPSVKATLDIKQARQSGIDFKDYLTEMGKDIVTVHLSDIDKEGKMCLPSEKGTFDFEELFNRLGDVGFNGALLIEAYQNDYKVEGELFESLEYLKTIAKKVFGKI